MNLTCFLPENGRDDTGAGVLSIQKNIVSLNKNIYIDPLMHVVHRLIV
jgi:hypothetical protein